MITLPTKFEGRGDQKGYVFKQLERIGNLCLYQKQNPSHESGKKFYEVFFVKTVPQRRFPNGNVIQAHEARPSPEEWGTVAWSPYDYEAAVQKFNGILERCPEGIWNADSKSP